MSDLSADLLGHFDGVTTLCQCWKLERRDGGVVRATDHDQSVVWQGETYLPGLSLTASGMTQALSLAPEPLDVEGALNADGLSVADLRAGLWDGARVTIWRVDWQAPEYGLWVWSGYLTEIEEQSSAFSVRLASLKSDLEKSIGRVFGRRCDAVLGDARCGVDTASAPQESCDKAFLTCRDVFANAENFRGFPFMPGNDVVISGPGEKRDGSGRGIIR